MLQSEESGARWPERRPAEPWVCRILLLACLWLVAAANAQMTPEQALDRRSISDLRLSPDGALLAFTVTEPIAGTTASSHIWVLSVGKRQARQFTTSAKSESSPRWSPDGSTLAFLSTRGGSAQIYLIPSNGGEARPLTRGKNSISAFEWSPDSQRIAFLAPEAPTEEEERKQKDKEDARVVDREDKLTRLWIVETSSSEVRQKTSDGWAVSEIAWAPDGKQIYAIATDRPHSDRWLDRIVSIALPRKAEEGGDPHGIARPDGPIAGLKVSPDGRLLSFLGSRREGPSPHDIYVVSIAGGEPRNATAPQLDRPLLEYAWRDARSILGIVATGFTSRFCEIHADDSASLLPEMPVNPYEFATGAGGLLLFAGQKTGAAPEIWISTMAGAAERATHLNARWDEIAVAEPVFLRYPSFDGTEIEAALLRPAGYIAGTRIPLVVRVHGGPTGRWDDRFEPWGQLLAARGYAVLYPNIRGSTGYGAPFVWKNKGDWGGGDFKDILAGVDYLIASGMADPERLGIGGWSYGGYMSAWAITQTQRFKASVVGAGLSDLASEFGTEDSSAYDEWFYGLPYENLNGFLHSSPVSYLKNAHTPTLILHGGDDPVDPIGQAQQLYRGLKRYGIPVEFVIYPRELHPVRERKHLLDLLQRMIAWYNLYLKAPTSPAPPSKQKTSP